MASGFDYARFPRRLNLGCGFDRRSGYLNVDLHPWHQPDLVADVCKLDFLPAAYYEEILAQDVLEHLPRTSTCKVLVHWNRLLAPRGVLRLRVPNAVAILERLTSRRHQSVASHEESIQLLFGTQAYTGDFHFTSFTDVLLKHYLQRTGYEILKLRTTGDGNFDCTATKLRAVHLHDVDDFSDLLSIVSDDEFVHECYRCILGRAPDDGGAHFYVSRLAQKRLSRDAVIEDMLNSDERRTHPPKRPR
jgi:predicted SAM-dependent methyltransferase